MPATNGTKARTTAVKRARNTLATACLVSSGVTAPAADHLLSGTVASAAGEKLGGVTRIPQRIGLVLQGESLLNDATALLIYLIVVRIAWLAVYRATVALIRRWRPNLADRMVSRDPRGTIVISWSGMRGLVTLATAFALPAQFSGRDLIVLFLLRADEVIE